LDLRGRVRQYAGFVPPLFDRRQDRRTQHFVAYLSVVARQDTGRSMAHVFLNAIGVRSCRQHGRSETGPHQGIAKDLWRTARMMGESYQTRRAVFLASTDRCRNLWSHVQPAIREMDQRPGARTPDRRPARTPHAPRSYPAHRRGIVPPGSTPDPRQKGVPNDRRRCIAPQGNRNLVRLPSPLGGMRERKAISQ
jgi:hypothetical protein